MRVLPLHTEVIYFLEKRNLVKKFEKQKALFEENPFYPSLQTELFEPKRMKIWSFRIDRKYRAIFIFRDRSTAQIIDVNNHYH